MDGVTEPLLFHPQGGLVRRARDAAHLTSLGVHVGRHRQERPGQRTQHTRRWHARFTTPTATLRVRRVPIVVATRVVPTLPATAAPAYTRLRDSRLPGLRMVAVGRRRPGSAGLDVEGLGLRMVRVAPTLLLRVVLERLATS